MSFGKLKHQYIYTFKCRHFHTSPIRRVHQYMLDWLWRIPLLSTYAFAKDVIGASSMQLSVHILVEAKGASARPRVLKCIKLPTAQDPA